MPELRVRRDDLPACELVGGEAPREDLAEGEAQLAVERFALTTNNITYAVLGDRLGYWQLFPAPDGWGRIPAWGYARVIGSRSPLAAVGTLVSGLVPMGPRVTVLPAPHPAGFVDAAPHRAAFAPVYRQYLPVEGEGDDAALVMRPLFATSVVLDLVLSEAPDAGASTVVLTSASSKTAYGLAHLLRRRRVRTVGLTSAARRDWVVGLGFYDLVASYDALDDLDVPGPAVLVDLAGNAALRRGIHERLGDALVRSLQVGLTHRQAAPDDAPLPGPAPAFFFAPDAIATRGQALMRAYARAWPGFAAVLTTALRIERVTAGDDLVRVYRALLDGEADPALGYVVEQPR
jgi:hypothetical protein